MTYIFLEVFKQNTLGGRTIKNAHHNGVKSRMNVLIENCQYQNDEKCNSGDPKNGPVFDWDLYNCLVIQITVHN